MGRHRRRTVRKKTSREVTRKRKGKEQERWFSEAWRKRSPKLSTEP